MHHTLKKVSVYLAGTVLVSLTLSGCGKPKPAAPPPSGPPEVGIIVVKQEKVSLTTELSGRTVPQQVAEVRPQVSGIILKRLFTEGSDVKAGQVLYQIDSAVFEAAHASAKAVQAKVEAALVSLRLTENRYRDLVKSSTVSQQDYDNASAALKQGEAELGVAKAAVEAARINLAYASVKAPISGRIGRSAVTNGALVTANQTTALATIQQLDTMYVDVTQSIADLLKLKQNLASGVLKKNNSAQAPVKLLLEDGSPYPVPGTLKFSEVTVDQSTGSVTLRAVFPNPAQALLPGMFVRALVVEGVNENAILIPQRGVTRNPKGDAVVMTVGAEEKVEPRPIKVIRTVGDNWLVGGGLKAGDRIILEGLQKARPGTPVKAVPFGSAPAAGPPGGAAPPVKK
jgi:membrane fusion protein (multidrug efflux system)